ncbi:transient receptor potential cation channel subfamily A member 1-like isoform X2 [Lineus longissimus]|uniref:transient receptor potential cation channel subfamily A member 1-like isoform X2 n=1 Tax=Lineus longissimus TaxID=88925 RepID=UPI00315CA1D0
MLKQGLAAKGSSEKLRSFLKEDPSRVGLVDQKGRSALHHAAEKGQIEVLEYVLSLGEDINLKDDDGNTALHLAAQSGKKEAVRFLLEHKASSDCLNNKAASPLHLAIQDDKAEVVEVMCMYKQVDVNFPTGCGATPLHVAAWINAARSVKILLNANANIEATCHPKLLTPFHAAAIAGAGESLRLILDYVQETLLSSDFLGLPDVEQSTPLHSAVSSGILEAVKVCLEAGGDAGSQQSDKSTPIHLACAKGSVEMVKVLLDSGGPQNHGFFTKNYIELRDGMEMTPLHHAALYDHVELCQYLIEKGADINAQDIEERTPLFLAAYKMAANVMCVLLARGADITIKDKLQRNFIHAAVISHCKLEALGKDISKYDELLNERDDNGCTPLHYASQLGLLNSMDMLISTGAALNPKTNAKESPLHFAAKYGRFNSCVKLLSGKDGCHLINEADGMYQTALHMAAENGHDKVVQLLMKRGAIIQKDNNANTPLHLAAKNGYNRTIMSILAVHAHILNSKGENGNTALHFASIGGHSSAVIILLNEGAEILCNSNSESFLDIALTQKFTDVALASVRHDRWEELFSTGSCIYMCYVLGFIKQLPEICPIVYDRMIKVEEDKNGNTVTTYNFALIQMNMKDQLEMRKNGQPIMPLATPNTMVAHNRVELLNHPLMVQYLNMKWNAYGLKLFVLSVFVYSIFLAALTYFVTSFPNWQHTDNIVGNYSDDDYYNQSYGYKFQFSIGQLIAATIIVVFCLLNMVKEVIQMVQQKMKYFLDVTNLLEWILYISCSVFLCPSLTMSTSTHFQWESGAVATFLAWVNLLLFFQRSGRFGIYVVMFLEILKTLIEVLVVFFVLIVAFGLAFYIVLTNKTNSENGQGTLGMMLLRCAMMMLGDYDFKETFLYPLTDSDTTTAHFATLTVVLLVAFILLMPILLMNLLIGLAVGDIESIQRNARLKRIAMQVELHTDLEKKLPAFFLSHVDKQEVVVKPCCSGYSKVLSSISTSRLGEGGSELDADAKKDAFVYEELFKQKQKMKEFSQTLEKTFDLVRLMVQKMEIKTEAENRDEGVSPCESGQAALNKHKLQLAVLSKLKR